MLSLWQLYCKSWINVNFFKIVLSQLSSEEETGTSHILLLMSTHILIITVLTWCKALMNSMVHTRIDLDTGSPYLDGNLIS